MLSSAIAPAAMAAARGNPGPTAPGGAVPDALRMPVAPPPEPAAAGSPPAGAAEAPAMLPTLWLPRRAGLDGAADPGAARVLFDGDARTALRLAPGQQQRVRIDLGATRTLVGVSLAGTGPATVGAYVGDGAEPRVVPGLEPRALALSPGRWEQVTPAAATPGTSLVVALTAGDGGAELRELRLWVLGPAREAIGEAPLADLLVTATPANAVRADGAPAEAEVARVATGGPSVGTFTVRLDRDPALLGRTFLVYELESLAHWTGASRSINGHVLRGGYRAGVRGLGGTEVEEIAPGWLRRGENTVTFQPSNAEDGLGYRVRRVRIVGAPAAGEARAGDRGPLDDGDRDTALGGRGLHTARLPSAPGAQPAYFTFYLQQPAEGALRVSSHDGSTHSRGEVHINLAGLPAGWQSVPLGGALPPAREVTVTLQGDREGTARIGEARVLSLPALDAASDLAIAYPLHGECIDHQAYVRGFVRGAGDLGGAWLAANGQRRAGALDADGSFAATVAEPAVARGKPWTLALEVAAPDGTRRTRAVPMDTCVEPPRPRAPGASPPVEDVGAPYGAVVSPGRARTLSFGDATLEVPAGAVDRDVRVTVRPLGAETLPPLGRLMTNVTPGGGLYRFGPHGLVFKRPVRMTLPVDPGRVPEGMSASDVHTFYYDEAHGRWVSLGRTAGGREQVLAMTGHFTDFISATLATPDHPTAQLFDPNRMKNIKLGDAGADIALMEPPEPDASGAAHLSYPLKMPAGRNGVQPDLALTYDSDRVNMDGWLGEGWNVALSSIEIDTRFGVPRYDGSETYLLDGAMLVQNPDGSFRRRVEGHFDHIVRVGGDPTSFHWEVTDKNGTKLTYGAQSGRLSDPRSSQGNIFRWYLESMQDTFGNTMTVSYVHDPFTNGDQFDQVYPQQIDYTSNGGLSAAYHVVFALDDGGTRPDVVVSGRSGFPVATRRRLVEIRVLSGTTPVRAYEFEYNPNLGDSFNKSVLSAVALRSDPADPASELYRHTFDYFTAPSTNAMFAPQSTWGPVQNADASPRADNGLDHATDELIGGSGSVGVGFSGIFSASVSAGGDTGNTTPDLMFIDATGDGLPDQVQQGGFASFNGLLGVGPSAHFTGGPFPGLGSIGHTNRSGWTVGGSIGVLDGLFGAGASYSQHTAEDDAVVADMNGDGFPDVVTMDSGTVNVRLNNGDRQLSAPQSWDAFSLSGVSFTRQDRFSAAGQAGAFFSADPLIRWTAPFSGTVTINSTLTKARTGGDGVRADLFVNGESTPRWTCAFAGDDLSPCPQSLSLTVNAGDRVYTKVDGLTDPSFDDLVSSLTIAYGVVPNLASLREPYGAPIYQFSQADDFRLAGMPQVPWTATAEGDVSATPCFTKTATADDITASVIHKRGTTVVEEFDQFEPAGNSGTFCLNQLQQTVHVQAEDTLSFQVTSDAQIDPTSVSWPVEVAYQNYCRIDPTTRASVCAPPVCLAGLCTIGPTDPLPEFPLPVGFIQSPSSVFYPAFEWTSDPPAPTSSFVVSTSGTQSVSWNVSTSGVPITVLVQGVNQLFAKQKLDAFNPTATISVSPSAQAGDQIFFTAFFPNGEASSGFSIGTPTVGGNPAPVNILFPDPNLDNNGAITDARDPMSGGYHRWFYGDWNGSRPFDETQIKVTATPKVTDSFLYATLAPFGLPARPDLGAIPMWLGRGSGEYMAAGRINPGLTTSGAAAGTGAGVSALRVSDTWNVDLQANATIISAAINDGDSTTDIDLLDLNGDRYPDSVSAGTVQYNDGVGAFTPRQNLDLGFDDVRSTSNASMRLAVDLGSIGQLINMASSRSKTSRTVATAAVSGATDYGVSSTRVDFLDVNGDGLVDHVSQQPGDAGLRVRLNLGYGFSKELLWSADGWQLPEVPASFLSSSGNVASDVIQGALGLVPGDVTNTNAVRWADTQTNDLSLGVSAGDVFGAGGGANATLTRRIVDFVDLNGDGLPDQVMRSPDEAKDVFRVKLNLGDHFGPETQWSIPNWTVDDSLPVEQLLASPDGVSYSSMTGWGASVHFQVCFIVCVGGSAFYQRDNGGSNMNFEDVDGDGKPDQVLKIDHDPNVYVKLNQTGKTNLLRAVHRPLGGLISLDYQRVGNRVDHEASPVVDMPTNQWALANVQLESGQPATQPQPLLQAIDYSAPGTPGLAVGFYDRAEREHYGYGDVKSSFPNEGTSITRQFLNHDYYQKGLVVAAAWNQVDTGTTVQTLKQETYSYADPSGDTPATQPVRTGTLFPAPRDKDTFWLEADPGNRSKHHQETRTFDTSGNLTDLVDVGDVDFADPTDDFNYHIDYVQPDAAHLVTKPSAITARTGQTQTGGALLRQRTATYFPTGKPQTVTDTIAGGKDPATGTPRTEQAPALATWTLGYDGFGNVTSAVGPEGHAFSYQYDPVAETYRITNSDVSLGYFSTASYDLRFGLPTAVTDIDGSQERTSYDDFGRPTQVFGALDFDANGVPTTPSLVFDYSEQPHDPSGFVELLPASATTSHKDVAPPEMSRPGDPLPARPGIRTVAFVDGLTRVIQTKKDITHDDGSGSAVDGMSVSGAVVFDSRGRVFQQGQPAFRAASTDFSTDIAMQNPATYAYDVLGRERQVSRPDASSVDAAAHGNLAVTTTSYQLGTLDGALYLLKLVQDPRGEVRSTFRSVREEVVAVDEVNDIGGVNDVHLVTRYAYDPLSQLLTTTDANENVTTTAYDTVGNLVALTSPDAGRTELRYDRAGNKAVKETANLRAAGKVINYVYNADRLQQVVYPTSPNVTYTYGAPSETGAAHGFVAGRVKTRVEESGETDMLYDGLGHVVQETTTFVDERLPKKPYVNTMSYSYDSFGRMLQMQFPGPGQEVVRYGYDRGGEVTSARGVNSVSKANKPPLETVYLQHIGYDEFGDRTRLLLGNGIPTTYAYEPDTRRLSQVNTDYRDPVQVAQNIGPLPMQRLQYAYDLVGNVRTLANAVPSESNDGSVVVGPTSFTFDYDRLYQLTHADGTYQDHVATRLRHSIDLAYDSIGNVTQKNQQDFQDTGGTGGTFTPGPARPQTTYLLNYSYAAPGPHQISHVNEAKQGNVSTPRDLSHDLDGNQTGWTFANGIHRAETWDEEDRLRQVQDQGAVVGQYLYRFDGVRTHSFVDGNETIYPNQYLSIRNGSFFTEHIYAGETRIASKVNADSLSNPDPIWYHPDHLHSTEFVSASDQSLIQHFEYFGSGETWDEQTVDALEPFRPAYQFTGKELDTKTGYYYMGARYYDPQLQNWQSTDPALTGYVTGHPNGGLFNPVNLQLYTYGEGNPIIKTDPTGRTVVVKNPAQKAYFEKLINSRALGMYKFNEHNELVRTKNTGDATKYSTYFADKLDAAIASDKTITLQKSNTYTAPGGHTYNIDVDWGNGFTQPLASGNVDSVISGHALTGLKDTAGHALRDDPADILVHEVVGHAVPMIGVTDTGNAVRNENKARAQEAGAGQRAAEPNHVEVP